MKLTGRTRYRQSLLRKIILQVEFNERIWIGGGPCGPPFGEDMATERRWRDATALDLVDLAELNRDGDPPPLHD